MIATCTRSGHQKVTWQDVVEVRKRRTTAAEPGSEVASDAPSRGDHSPPVTSGVHSDADSYGGLLQYSEMSLPLAALPRTPYRISSSARRSGTQGFDIRGDSAHLILREVLDHVVHNRRGAQSTLINERPLYQIVGVLPGEPRENTVARACGPWQVAQAGIPCEATPSSKICLPRAMSFASPVLARDGAGEA
jgi:hypothetical protein